MRHQNAEGRCTVSMKIYINKKTLGKKSRALEPAAYEVPENIETLEELLKELVRIEVENYNSKGTDNQTIFLFDEQTLEEHASTGKVGFGRLYSEKKAELDKATENALQGFRDGLVRVVWNEQELEHLNDKIALSEGDVVTFIRVTFLTGRLW